MRKWRLFGLVPGGVCLLIFMVIVFSVEMAFADTPAIPKDVEKLLKGYVQNIKYAEDFLEIQKKAGESGEGLWFKETEQLEQKESLKDRILLTVDLERDFVVIKNISDKVIDFTGYVLVSVKGNQQFTLPVLALKPSETVTVTSGKNARHDPPRYLLWTKKHIWNNDGDPAELWSPAGELVASWPSESINN